MSVQSNLESLKLKIESLEEKYNRKINLIAVSKQKPLEDILEAYESGQRIFGENRIQEAVEKLPQVNKNDIEWHFIGHLQRNKVKQAVPLFDVIHSIDKYETALEVNKRCEALNKRMKVFLQVNTTGEAQKSGVEPEGLEELIKEIRPLEYLDPIGLMTMGLFTDDKDIIKKSFTSLRELRDQVQINYPYIKELSMGMSNDYEIAVEEGATYIRVGTSIFGKRAK